MCIRFINKKPKLQDKEITITENGTQTVTPDTGKDGLSSVEITTNVSSGGGAVEEKDVNFYDYDGTLLHSYTKSDFLALSAMPENPTHTGLVAQGWNWDLADAKTHVTDYDELDIGQVYTTASGLSEFDIELNAITGLSVTLNMNGTKNWGDGTTDTNTSHTYANAGKYTISCDGTQGISLTDNNGLFGQTSSVYNQSLIFARLENFTGAVKQVFHHCRSLKYITISKDVTADSSFCNYCYSLEFIIFKKNNFSSNMFEGSTQLKKILTPNVSASGIRTFNACSSLKVPTDMIYGCNENMMSGCSSLQNKKLKFRGTMNYIYQGAFSNIYIPVIYDFTRHTSVPILVATSAFNKINALTKIVVPNSLYDTWITASNWTTYASYIIKESDYNAS